MTALLGAHDIRDAAAKVLGPEWANTPAIRDQVDWHAAQYAAQLHRLWLSLGHDRRTRRARQDDALKTYSGVICGLLRAARRRDQHLTYDQIQKLAMTTLWDDPGEPVTFVPEVKLDGSIRPALKFGVRRLAQQFHVRDVLRIVLRLSSHDYSLAGRGAHRAVEKLVPIINGGAKWFYRGDILNCFGSFTAEATIALLPLPEAVTRNTVLLSEDVHIQGDLSHYLTMSSLQALRSGLPQGSLLSSLVASAHLRTIYDDMASEFEAVAYVDDFAAACYTEEEGYALHNALTDRLAILPGGGLKLKFGDVSGVWESPTFLGYTFVSDPDGRVRLQPMHHHFQNCLATIRKVLEGISASALESTAMGMAADFMKRWPAWDAYAGLTELEHNWLENQAFSLADEELGRRQVSEPLEFAGNALPPWAS